MPIQLPASLKVTRSKRAERALTTAARAWVSGDRKPGVHASGLLDPRKTWFDAIDPKDHLDDRLVWTFLPGKVLHAFILSAVKGKSLDWAADGGSKWSKRLGIWYSPDDTDTEGPIELKTSRSYYPPKGPDDIKNYLEQLWIYMVAEKKTKGKLHVLYLNLKDEQNRTSPTPRCYTITASKADLAKAERDLAAQRALIELAIKRKDHTMLPLCREWLCSRRMCDRYDACKPEGRYKPPKPPRTGHEDRKAKETK